MTDQQTHTPLYGERAIADAELSEEQVSVHVMARETQLELTPPLCAPLLHHAPRMA